MTDWTRDIDRGEYGASNRNWGGMIVNPAVFVPTAILSFSVILFSLIAPQASADLFSSMRVGAVTYFDWFFIATVINIYFSICPRNRISARK